MAVTYAINPNPDAPQHYIGASTDTKPTIASHADLPRPTIFSKFYAYNTYTWYVTYDGTNWVELKQPSLTA